MISRNDTKCFARLFIFKNVVLNQVQECKVDIEKKSRRRTSRGEKKSGSKMPRDYYIERKNYELDEKEEAGSQETRQSRSGNIT